MQPSPLTADPQALVAAAVARAEAPTREIMVMELLISLVVSTALPRGSSFSVFMEPSGGNAP